MQEYEVRIPKATWAAGAAQNTGIVADLALAAAVQGINGNARNLVKSITIVSQDNGSWELWAFATAVRYPASRDANKFLGRWTFVVADGVQDAADGASFYYYIDGNDLPLRDDDNTGKLHLTLIRRDAALVAGHEVVIELHLQPIGAA